MGMTSIDASQISKCFLSGAKTIEKNKDFINELNVFPVPDGDTGTNMTATIMAAAKEVVAASENDMAAVCKAMSSGSLRGARGNSGVILSQLLRGFTKPLKTEKTLDVKMLAVAMQNACDTAYKAVMKPMEGTILTVARGAAEKAMALSESTDDIVFFAEEIAKEAEEILKKTPEMLPVLKEAGVVDSGGQGLVCVLQGVRDFLQGKEIDLSLESFDEEKKKEEKEESAFSYEAAFRILPSAVFTDADESEMKRYYASIGENVYISRTVEDVCVTLRTNDPGHVLTKALSFGPLTSVSIVNDRLEPKKKGDNSLTEFFKRPETESAPKEQIKKEEHVSEKKEIAFVAVSIGKGLNSIFKELGADFVIEGGQTMNPSTEDILKAVKKANAKTCIVLPNNKNIILAANQARDIATDCEVIVLPTKTIPQGISALINYIPEESAHDNAKRMLKEIDAVKSAEITYAVRDTKINDHVIHKGDYMGIGDKGLLSVNPDIQETFVELLNSMLTEESSLVTVYFGKDVKKKELKKIEDRLRESFPEIEFEIEEGGQPVYYFIISVE